MQTIVADAMEPVRQHVDQKARSELVGGKMHDGSFVAQFYAIIFPFERDGVGISTDQTVV